ncbi:hypothetical protein MAR_029740 [Mya arenaria]|uniref:Uncharacterized protein n=1 Tax=Mya arenaria TaxID=6604 RepID=A0ABY7DK35_MYAAR|nr:hypothetical protein MAR_029740 [Mya arenaria]
MSKDDKCTLTNQRESKTGLKSVSKDELTKQPERLTKRILQESSRNRKSSKSWSRKDFATTKRLIYVYGAAPIMSVTEHRSVQSVSFYQRVDTDERMKMVQTLTSNLIQDNVSSQKKKL